ncbi:FHA domain-containing protein [Cognatazoarcus halotolerans]|uniref:FHA domain-containing protein n=1 Tax=Cognatazoarcus halotolerans TaxID=2686016 RepID=UPI001359294A|nr:FHA domain-containing protein [Cognatazoarcus halotolerans]MCB1902275.1 hypothetical protein [Rhodocyclaceae bacterium]MCP5309953.1 hypothetical protein [Zoogloeaceae bacterium]
MSIWIEELSWNHRIARRSRFEACPVKIGRGYGNHLFIDDPHVTQNHLLVSLGPDAGLQLSSPDDAAFKVDGRRICHEASSIHANSAVQIGKTRLRIRTEHDPAAPPPSARKHTEAWRQACRSMLASAPLLVGMSISVWGKWASSWQGYPIWHHLPDTLTVLFAAVPWISIWALASLLLNGVPSILRHMLIAGSGYTGLQSIGILLPIVFTAVGLQTGEGTRMLLAAVAWGVTILGHLLVVARGRALSPALASGLLLLVIATGASWYGTRQTDARQGRPAVDPLIPPSLHVGAIVSQEALRQRLTIMEAQVQAARSEPVPLSAR